VSRAACFPCTLEEWLECRLSRPGRVGPTGALGLAGMADGMAAGVGWDVEALGMAAVVAMVFLTAGPEVAECLADKVCCVYVWPRGARAGRRQISVRPNAAELVRAKRAVRVVDDGKRGRWWRM